MFEGHLEVSGVLTKPAQYFTEAALLKDGFILFLKEDQTLHGRAGH